MGFGAPVICSNTTSLPEIVAEAGMLLPPDDGDAWVAALVALTAMPERRKALAGAARARARSFDWQRSAVALLGLYEDAVSEARSRR